MTNFERLQAMDIDQLSEWLDEQGQVDNSRHVEWFNSKYCENCPSVMRCYENSKWEFPCSWCEIHGKCKFFPEMDEVPDNKEMIKMWLKSEEY